MVNRQLEERIRSKIQVAIVPGIVSAVIHAFQVPRASFKVECPKCSNYFVMQTGDDIKQVIRCNKCYVNMVVEFSKGYIVPDCVPLAIQQLARKTAQTGTIINHYLGAEIATIFEYTCATFRGQVTSAELMGLYTRTLMMYYCVTQVEAESLIKLFHSP